MPVEDTDAHPLTVREKYKAGCHSRKPRTLAFYTVQDGWTDDGRRRMIIIPADALSTKCRQIKMLPECEGCTSEKDIEYINKMTKLDDK